MCLLTLVDTGEVDFVSERRETAALCCEVTLFMLANYVNTYSRFLVSHHPLRGSQPIAFNCVSPLPSTLCFDSFDCRGKKRGNGDTKGPAETNGLVSSIFFIQSMIHTYRLMIILNSLGMQASSYNIKATFH